MTKRMLIDATHPEETRVVVVNGTRLEELDVETSTKRQIKGNIYLARVIRVEPSLQAAFVDYGGNRHGFLAFSEIHPDYFQIPAADRQALLAAQRAEVVREAQDDADATDDKAENEKTENADAPAEATADEVDAPAADAVTAEADTATEAVTDDASTTADTTENTDDTVTPTVEQAPETEDAPAPIETLGGEDLSEQELSRRRAKLLRNYKIQDVIKRRQILLVQVIKEERGTKGAALTTYLSLAGRYCVLMPNTARGGGVSRKIVNTADRRRLKAIAAEIDTPEGMATIIRTAGSERSKVEIRRDYEYLLRAWEQVRDLALRSLAPALVYEEASLIKRSIRDVYSRDIEEILVEGDEGYRLAKDYMRMLTPSHAKKVQPYRDATMPLLYRYQVESQLDAMHSPIVQLRSGGYLVIGQTEALVAIDVNSGRATKERHIEETALKTNLEAADEVARQLRLRDLAGLVVIDFIDMEENRNNHAVERRLKDALKSDRARIQVGKISGFGLLELSRQRLRPSLQETSFTPCPHCMGTGSIRSVESSSMHVLRAIEDEGIRRRGCDLIVYVATDVALYILNHKREALLAIEERYQFRVMLQGDNDLIAPNIRMERIRQEGRPVTPDPRTQAVSLESSAATVPPAVEEDESDDPVEETAAKSEKDEAEREDGEGRRRRRRRRRKGRSRDNQATASDHAQEGNDADGSENGDDTVRTGEDSETPDVTITVVSDAISTPSGEDSSRRRRSRRGNRRNDKGESPVSAVAGALVDRDAIADIFEAVEDAVLTPVAATTAIATDTATVDAAPDTETSEKPKRRSRSRRKTDDAADATDVPAAETNAEAAPAKKTPRTRRPRKTAETTTEAAVKAVAEAVVEQARVPTPAVEMAAPPPAPVSDEPPAPPRRGWWSL